MNRQRLRRAIRLPARAVLVGIALVGLLALAPRSDFAQLPTGEARDSNLLAELADVLDLGATPANADTVQRRVDFSGYCKARYRAPGVSVSAWHKWTGSWTAVTWRCRTTGIVPSRPPFNFASVIIKHIPVQVRDYQIDVNAVCRWQYGRNSWASMVGRGWDDWRCRTYISA
jgi:hypothetical protein